MRKPIRFRPATVLPLVIMLSTSQAALPNPKKNGSRAQTVTQPAKAEKSIADKVRDIIVEQLGVKANKVTPAARYVEDLGADSLDAVELTMAFEEEFNIEIPDEDAEKLKTVGQTTRYVEAKLTKATGKPKKEGK